MTQSANTPPKRKLHSIRENIPSGYFLGRISAGDGDVELISMEAAQAKGLIPTKLPPSGAAGGDLSGTYPNPTVAAIQGKAISNVAPTGNQVLMWIAASAKWVATTIGLIPAGGTTGQVLEKNSNTDYDLKWATPSSGGAPASCADNGTLYFSIVDSNGQLVLDSNGNPIYAAEVLPPSSLPVGSASQFGALKVDNFSIQALSGVIGTLFQGFMASMSGTQNVTDGIYAAALYDTSIIDTMSAYVTGTGIYTPTKAGKYLVFCSLKGQTATVAKICNAAITKNGLYGGGGTSIAFGQGTTNQNATNETCAGFCVGITTMNGTTDNLRVSGFVVGTGGSDEFLGSGVYSFFGAIYLGA